MGNATLYGRKMCVGASWQSAVALAVGKIGKIQRDLREPLLQGWGEGMCVNASTRLVKQKGQKGRWGQWIRVWGGNGRVIS